ncbi:MAG: ACP S-malonyltransferase [Deltaproteobacteria bacterium]|nr:ACP S-malonyltransferase [Deltaproteobacteria bacterium]
MNAHATSLAGGRPAIPHATISRAVAVVFPGQGSQKPGMARDFHDAFATSRDAFAEASDALNLDVAALCFGDDPRLDRTEFTQPAILTAEIAMMRALEREFGLRPTHFGGHSLGEYTALCAAGVLSLGTAVRLVRRRGALMQDAVPVGEGAMVAVVADGVADLGLEREIARLGVDVANRNSMNQIVLSGERGGVEAASALVAQLLGGAPHEIIALNVSAPFHSRRLRGIEAEFRGALVAVAPELAPSRAGVVTSNLTGRFHRPELEPLLDALTRQLSGTVDWIGNMRALGDAASEIYEVGPGRPLRGFFKSAGREVTAILSVKTAEKGLRS